MKGKDVLIVAIWAFVFVVNAILLVVSLLTNNLFGLFNFGMMIVSLIGILNTVIYRS